MKKFFDLMQIFYRFDQLRTSLVAFLLLVSSVWSVLRITALSNMADVFILTDGLTAGIISVLLWGGVVICSHLLNAFSSYSLNGLTRRTAHQLNHYASKQNRHLSLEVENDTAFQEEYNNYLSGARELPTVFIGCLELCFGTIPFILFTGWLLASYYLPLIAAVLLLCGQTVLVVVKTRNPDGLDESFQAKKTAELKQGYYRSLLFKERALLEIIATRSKDRFFGFYSENTQELSKIDEKIASAYLKCKRKAVLFSVVGYLAVLVLFTIALTNHKVSIGEFIALLSVSEMLVGSTKSGLAIYFDSVREKQLYIKSFLDFDVTGNYRLPPNQLVSATEVRLENVGFHYPGETKLVLQQINLTVTVGEKIAIVGENGSGKSTLLKLLLGLYQPTTGRVYYPKGTGQKPVFGKLSGLTQSFNRYKLSFQENIAISQDVNRIEKDALQQASCRLELAPKLAAQGITWSTNLSKDFGGLELSGGTWQRVALGRSFYKAAGFLFWDEPTSAIDPLEEQRLFTVFKKIGQEKTTLLVTHKLAAAKDADVIYVLDQGKIIEQGNHQELLAIGGKYSNMWQTQVLLFQNK